MGTLGRGETNNSHREDTLPIKPKEKERIMLGSGTEETLPGLCSRLSRDSISDGEVGPQDDDEPAGLL